VSSVVAHKHSQQNQLFIALPCWPRQCLFKTFPYFNILLYDFYDFYDILMASQSFLRASVKSPARAFIKPTSSRSILKRPTPLPLSPNPIPFAATFSIAVSSPAKLSPHVHFAASPAMVATFSAHSPRTYDRTAIAISPTSAGASPWAGRVVSPSVNMFKLSDPPKRNSTTSQNLANLTVPTLEDPRSPKPYRPRAGVRFEELTFHVPRGTHGVEDLGKALSTYPRSPYPSAPITADEGVVMEDAQKRGRTSHWPNQRIKSDKQTAPTRARSLENTKRYQKPPPLNQNFLSPVTESPRVVVTKPAPLPLGTGAPKSTSLSQAFWQSVSLEEPNSAGPASTMDVSETLMSPPHMLFGNKDGSLWSPRPAKMGHRTLMPEMSMLSPAQKIALSKGLVASPSPNDPFAAFPSFSVALMGMDGIITYPPRAAVEQR